MQPLSAPAPQTYDQAYGSLGSVYDPQVQAAQAQVAPQMSALDQAKVNAFRDITSSANSKGMLFSGFAPDQQAQYIGTKYLPAVANLQAATTNAVNKLNASRVSQAQDIVTKGQQAANDAQYKNMQLQLEAQRNAIAASKIGASTAITPYQQAQLNNAAASRAMTQQTQYNTAMKNYQVTIRKSDGGYMIQGPSGQAVSLAKYAGATGQSLLDLLSSSQSQYDKNAYNFAVQSANKGQSEDQILAALQKKYSKIF